MDFWGNGFAAILVSKKNLLSISKEHFEVFCKYFSEAVETIFGKVSQSVQNYLNQNLVIRSLLRHGFEAALSSKTNVFSLWKKHFSNFWKYFSHEVDSIFWESEAKCLKMFKSKFGHRKLLREWLRSYLELKNECPERLKRAFFSFLQIFEWRSWKHFLGKWGKALKTVKIKIWSQEAS